MGHLREELEVLKGQRSVHMHAQASFQCCSDLTIVGFSLYSVLKSLQQLPSRAGNSGLTSRKRTVTELKIEVSLRAAQAPGERPSSVCPPRQSRTLGIGAADLPPPREASQASLVQKS